ncbi:TMEM165/GDT1 family protein [Halarchaeum salinum]|uniref:TMEM165/GDT1 family protein n=1 Tax=Halarchaeum salinum TaxID=489912 RepID=A0AAV3S333_9EURY
MALVLDAGGISGLIQQYEALGPFVASLVTNFLATFGDKGQLAVITLATIYDTKRVFAGAITAFAIWNVIEVSVGTAVLGVLPAGVTPIFTGGLFVLVGLWTCFQAYSLYTSTEGRAGATDAFEGILPDGVYERIQGSSAFVVAFVAIAVAEFGDKTQLLTINLAATFPNAPLAVIAGAWLGLAIRTGIDAFIGQAAEQFLPMALIQAAGAAVFVAVGLFQWGLLAGSTVVVIAAAAVAFAVGGAIYRRVTEPQAN